MYHQFKQLADIDITTTADGSRPDDALRDGRRSRGCRHADVDAARAVRGRRMRRRASTAPTGSAAIRSRICSSSANAPASTPQNSRRRTAPAKHRRGQVERGNARERSRRSSAAPTARTRIKIQHDLQETMQDLVGIVRIEDGDACRRWTELTGCRNARRTPASPATASINPGWHTALDLRNLLTVSEAITRSALERKESRGAHFRDDYPDKDGGLRQDQHRRSRKRPDGSMQVVATSRFRRCRRIEAGDRGE